MINEKNDTVFQKIVHFVSISLFSWSFTLAVTAVTIMQILPKVSQRKCPGVGNWGYQSQCSEIQCPARVGFGQSRSEK